MIALAKKPKKEKPVKPVVPQGGDDEETRYRPIEFWLVKKLISSYKPHRSTYTAGIAACLVHVMTDQFDPMFIGAIVNFCAAYVSGQPHSQSMPIEKFFNLLLPNASTANLTPGRAILHVSLIIGVWAVAVAVSLVLQRATILLMTKAGESVQFDFRKRMFAHLQRLSMSYYDKTKLGRIISRMTSDINGMREVNAWGMAHMTAQPAIILFASGMMCWVDWRLFLSVAWLAPVVYVMNLIFIRKAGKQHQVVREGFTRLSSNLAENINGMRVVTAFNRQDPNLTTFNQLQDQNTINNAKSTLINAVFQPSLELVRHLGRVIVLILGGYLMINGIGNTNAGSVVAAFLYWDRLMGSIVFLGGFYNQLMQAMAGAERVFSLFDIKPEVEDVPQAQPLPPIVGRVEFQGVTFGYDPNRPILHDINFQALPGQTVALVGHTGSGKSSISSLIARFYQPQQGKILVDGFDIRHVTGDSLHHQMGIVAQSNFLFTGSVMDNIRYASPSATRDQVIDAARALGTHDIIETLKNGYDTDVGERGSNMSLGQRQLICFTRAFLADPRIFILDEATSAIDTHTEIVLQTSLEKLTRGRTTFIVAHRLSTIINADQILVLEQGRIIERGNHQQLLEMNGKYATLYENFSKGISH